MTPRSFIEAFDIILNFRKISTSKIENTVNGGD
jgi:hypothetical protein